LCTGCAKKDDGESGTQDAIQSLKTDAAFDRVERLEDRMARDYATMVEPGDSSWMDADELRLATRWTRLSPNENGAKATIEIGNLLSMDAHQCIADIVWGSTDKDGRFTKTKTALVKIPELSAGRYVRLDLALSEFTPDQIGRLTIRHVTCIGSLGPTID
jgi:hypothetical protein